MKLFLLFSISILSTTPNFVLAVIADAKEAVAESDVVVYANAMAQNVAFTNFFTTIENLDDLGAPTITYPFDYINDNGGALVVSPFTGEIRQTRIDYLNRPIGLAYDGPYVAPFSNLNSRGRFTDDTHFYDEGHPLDPWFHPYLFYTPLGLVVPKTESIQLAFHEDRFNQFTIASLGADGIVSDDDIIRSIGGFFISTLAISSARIQNSNKSISTNKQSSPPYQMVIKGYNFGSTRGDGGITLDSTPAPIISWSETQVVIKLTTIPTESVAIELTKDNGSMKLFSGFIDERPDADVLDWELY